MLSAFDTVSELEPLCFPGAGRFENSTLGSTPLAVRVVVSCQGDSCQANRVLGLILTPGGKKGKEKGRTEGRTGRGDRMEEDRAGEEEEIWVREELGGTCQ